MLEIGKCRETLRQITNYQSVFPFSLGPTTIQALNEVSAALAELEQARELLRDIAHRLEIDAHPYLFAAELARIAAYFGEVPK